MNDNKEHVETWEHEGGAVRCTHEQKFQDETLGATWCHDCGSFLGFLLLALLLGCAPKKPTQVRKLSCHPTSIDVKTGAEEFTCISPDGSRYTMTTRKAN